MKIKDLATMAGNCKKMRLINTKGVDGEIIRQHLDMNGVAVYPLDGMQPITPETLLTIADVDNDIRDSYTVDQVEMTSWLSNFTDDQRPDDVMLAPAKIRIKTRKGEMIALSAGQNGETVFLSAPLIKPIKDVVGLEFALRRIGEEGNEQIVIVALEGFANIGAFAPATKWAEQEEAEELWRIAAAARKLANENAMDPND